MENVDKNIKTPMEIAQWYVKNRGDDFLSFQLEVVGDYIDLEAAKFLQEKGVFKKDIEITKEHFPNVVKDCASVIAAMSEYMIFAWDKALSHRGISASRSIEKMEVWLAILGDEDVLDGVEYAMYGVPKLVAICKKYGFSIVDSKEATNMARGIPCELYCRNGCGE